MHNYDITKKTMLTTVDFKKAVEKLNTSKKLL